MFIHAEIWYVLDPHLMAKVGAGDFLAKILLLVFVEVQQCQNQTLE